MTQWASYTDRFPVAPAPPPRRPPPSRATIDRARSYASLGDQISALRPRQQNRTVLCRPPWGEGSVGDQLAALHGQRGRRELPDPRLGLGYTYAGYDDVTLTHAELCDTVPDAAHFCTFLRWLALLDATGVIVDLSGRGEWLVTWGAPGDSWTFTKRGEWLDTMPLVLGPINQPIHTLVWDPPEMATDEELLETWPVRWYFTHLKPGDRWIAEGEAIKLLRKGSNG